MITQISTTEDVKLFAKQLIAEEVNFHPDNDFNDYVNIKEHIPYYTKEAASLRNKLMKNCVEVCEKEGEDVYTLMLEVTLAETGMDKFIPLPSQQLTGNN